MILTIKTVRTFKLCACAKTELFQIELFFDIENCIYTKLNCWTQSRFDMQLCVNKICTYTKLN